METVEMVPVGYVNRLSNPTQISATETAELEMPVFGASEVERWKKIAQYRYMIIREMKAEIGDALDLIGELRSAATVQAAT